MSGTPAYATTSYRGLPLIVHSGLTGWWARREVDEYLTLLRLTPADRVLDVGANIGAFAVPASKLCATVMAYEPDAENCTMLQANLALNGCTNVRAHRAAVVGDGAPAVAFYQGATSTRHTIVSPGGVPASVVPAVNIDAALVGSGANAVKLDAEGAEVSILGGLRRWGQIDRMVLEYHADVLGDRDEWLWARLRACLQASFGLVTWRHALLSPLRTVYCSRRPADLALGATGWPGIRWTRC